MINVGAVIAGLALSVTAAAIILTIENGGVAPPKLDTVRDCAPGGFVPAPSDPWTDRATAIIDGDSFCMDEVEIRTQRWNTSEWDEDMGAETARVLALILQFRGPLTCAPKARSYDRVIALCTLADGTPLHEAMKEAME